LAIGEMIGHGFAAPVLEAIDLRNSRAARLSRLAYTDLQCEDRRPTL